MASQPKVIIIGAGPGGVQASYFLTKHQIPHFVLERSSHAGSFFSTFPVHRKLISLNKKYNFYPEADFNMRHDWNSLLSDDMTLKMTDYSEELFPHADILRRYIQDFADRYSLPIHYNEEVLLVDQDESGEFSITTSKAKYQCHIVLCATGPAVENVPEIPGIDLTLKYSNYVPNSGRYRNKRVLIIGGGNSAFETANELAGESAIIHIAIRRPIRHAWDTHFVGDLRAVNNDIVDMYQLKSLHATIGDPPHSIEKLPDGSFCVTFKEFIGHPDIAIGEIFLRRVYDEVICCTGFRFVPQIFSPRCTPLTHTYGKFASLTPLWESQNVTRLFFIGTSMQSIDRKASSGFIHGFRYNVRSFCKILSHILNGVPLCPELKSHEGSFDELSKLVCDRLTTVASLFQMFGRLCDAILVHSVDSSSGKMTFSYYNDLPRHWIMEGKDERAREVLFGARDIYLITFQFGFEKYPRFVSANEFLQDTGSLNGSCGAFLHPVLEHFRDGKLCDSYHLFETLDIRFNTQFKPGESGSTLNESLLTDILFSSLSESLSLSLPRPSSLLPLARLTSSNTPLEEKKRLFKEVMPVERVWSEEELLIWQRYLTHKDEEMRRSECQFRPVPVCDTDLEKARDAVGK